MAHGSGGQGKGAWYNVRAGDVRGSELARSLCVFHHFGSTDKLYTGAEDMDSVAKANKLAEEMSR